MAITGANFDANSPITSGPLNPSPAQTTRQPKAVRSVSLKGSRITDISHLPQMSGFGKRMPKRLGAPRVKRTSNVGLPRIGKTGL